MAYASIPLYMRRRCAKRNAPIQKLPNEIFDMVLSYLPTKADKLSVLFSCRTFAQLLPAQKIRIYHGPRAHWELLPQIGSGANTHKWAFCYQCSLLRPTDAEKWAGGRHPFGLPEDFDVHMVSFAVLTRYRGLCLNWANGAIIPGRVRYGSTCPECYLLRKRRKGALGLPWA